MKKSAVLAVFILITLLITQFASFAFAAPPEDKGPPTLEKMVFVHYRGDVAPGKPVGTPVKPDKTTQLYVYNKIHWPYTTAAAGIVWYYNPSNSPAGDCEQAMIASFEEWDSVVGANIEFACLGSTSKAPGWGSSASPDGDNVVGWDDITSEYKSAIGVTIVWYYRSARDKIIVECDTTLNTNIQFAWTWSLTVVEPDGTLITPDTGYYDVDVQNIMTHEAGHWMMLGDMYDTVAAEQTMFGIAYDRELNKRTLESGDKAGINVIY